MPEEGSFGINKREHYFTQQVANMKLYSENWYKLENISRFQEKFSYNLG